MSSCNPLLALGCLAAKGIAGATSGACNTRVCDTGSNGLLTGIGGGAGVAGQPGTQDHWSQHEKGSSQKEETAKNKKPILLFRQQVLFRSLLYRVQGQWWQGEENTGVGVRPSV